MVERGRIEDLLQAQDVGVEPRDDPGGQPAVHDVEPPILRQVGIPVACTVQPLAGGVLPQPQVLYVEGRDAHGGKPA